MLNELKRMLNDVLLAKTRGVTYPRLARAHGYVDGYMKALLDSGHRLQPGAFVPGRRGPRRVDGPGAIAERRPPRATKSP